MIATSTMSRKSYTLLMFVLIAVAFLISNCSQGNKGELSRGKAEKMIKEFVSKNPVLLNSAFVRSYTKDKNDEYFVISFVDAKNDFDTNAFKKLEQQGFVKMGIIREKYNGITFTDKAKPYFVTESKGIWKGSGDDNIDSVVILLAEVDKVEVDGITLPSGEEGKKMCHVDYKIYYKPTPFGTDRIKPIDLTKKGRMPFTLYDDGWRIAL